MRRGEGERWAYLVLNSRDLTHRECPFYKYDVGLILYEWTGLGENVACFSHVSALPQILLRPWAALADQ